MKRCATLFLIVLGARVALASDQFGQVTFSNLPVPGATVTATRADVARVTVSDEQGVFRFADLADGPWTMQVEMLGFSTLRRDIVVASEAAPVVFALSVLPFEAIASGGALRVSASPPQHRLPPRCPRDRKRPAARRSSRDPLVASSGRR